MLSLKTVAKKEKKEKKRKLDFTHLCRHHSAAEEPTEKKFFFSGFTARKLHYDFYNSDSVTLGGIPVASLGWGLLCCTYIPMCLCESLSFLGEGGGRFFF